MNGLYVNSSPIVVGIVGNPCNTRSWAGHTSERRRRQQQQPQQQQQQQQQPQNVSALCAILPTHAIQFSIVLLPHSYLATNASLVGSIDKANCKLAMVYSWPQYTSVCLFNAFNFANVSTMSCPVPSKKRPHPPTNKVSPAQNQHKNNRCQCHRATTPNPTLTATTQHQHNTNAAPTYRKTTPAGNPFLYINN
jgi:hypothetical protein